MKLRHIFTALAAAALTLVGCQEELKVLDEVQVSQSLVAIPVEGGSVEVTVNANDAWAIAGAPEWLTVSPASGEAGETVVTFSAEATDATRDGVFYINVGEVQQVMNVLQMAEKVETPLSTCADVNNNGVDGKVYRVKGTCTSIANTQYGNWYLTDDTGTVWTFHLGEDRVWSDGEPVTAEQYVYSLQRTADPETGSPNSFFVSPIKNYNAIAAGADAIMIAANGPDAIVAALEEAQAEGIKIIYVDSPANLEAEATFSTNNEAAGTTAGEQMLAELEAQGITEGKIGIVNANSATDTAIKREAGFRAAFEGTAFEILETQYGEGDAAKSQEIADNYITEGCVGIFGCNEGSTVGVGNAIKGNGGGIVGVGFDKSDSILSLIKDGSLLCTMAQNPDVMGYEGM